MRILRHCILTILILLLCSECVGGLRVSSGLRAGMMLSTTSSFSHRTNPPIITTMLEKSIGSERRTRSIMGLPSSTRLSLSSISISDGVVVNNDAVSKSFSRLFAGGTQGQKVSKRGTIGFLEEEYEEDAQQESKNRVSLKDELDKDWMLILHDDPVHTIPQVASIISELVPLCSPPRAWEVTLTVHTKGMGIITSGNKKLMEEYVHALQSAGLNASIGEQDQIDSKKGSDGDGDGYVYDENGQE